MQINDVLASEFEQNRSRLRAVAYRMLGSLSEAEDAVQEAWLRLGRSDAASIDNLGGWLTTVVSRVCLDVLRSRKSRREDSLDAEPVEPASHKREINPEQEAELASSVGLAMLVVLDTLSPPERLAFVLHDMFDLSFDEIAGITGRTTAAARQLASRARRRVQGQHIKPTVNFTRQRRVVEAFLAAARKGDFDGLVSLLDPNAVLVSDPAAARGLPAVLEGAEAIAKRAVLGGARAAQPMLVDGTVGVVVAPRGRLLMVLRFTIVDDKVTRIESIAAPEHVSQLDLAVLS
ncbi:DNA-directed RNA polymerase sigma-70 factor [Edaphobacter acidisoli]|uniref:DNA-directed RNA polymerase sigma-70 factor n=1 Tax=Edaphobacter acidisoli TaxID=2040573 RepID=A0A916RV82_9BACT|nr:sigma-70 family RNA polymerase sigma factor [Edaphobacter acidisoli]GGA72807.1 DNA-directed RNA polymerase sigma-70 factor [Edaphobacter acidisoli]